MLGDPPVVTLKRQFERPSTAQIKALQNVPTGFVVDLMMGQGAVDRRIKPLWPDSAFTAPVLTADCGPRDNLGLLVALEVAEPGDVVALATGGFEETAVLGDHVAAMAKNKGIVAFITDGLVRDVDGLIEVGLSVYGAGVSPNSPYKSGPCEVGTSVTLGGVAVASGDLMVGDRDGVVVVPRARIDSVIAGLADVQANEDAMGEKIANGLTAPGWVKELLASDQTLRLD
ncbi:MAG: RraA family protein [Geminicoccaceae bacterium]